MSKIFATGNLEGVGDSSPVYHLEDKATGGIGFLFTGVFGATGVIDTLGVVDPYSGNPRELGFYGPSGTLEKPEFDAPGLYLYKGFIDNLKLTLSLGTALTTNIDYTIFLAPRP